MNNVFFDKDKSSETFEKLICEMLRGPHLQSMNADQLRSYTYKAGVALHNIPHFIAMRVPLSIDILKQIDELDPSTRKGSIRKRQGWGNWVSNLVPYLIDELPNI